MKLDELRHRRRARRSRRQRNPSAWGSASLIVGAGAFVLIYLAARNCAEPPPPLPSGPLTIEVTVTEVRIDGQVVVAAGTPAEEVEEQLLRALRGRTSDGAPRVQGSAGVNFARLQAIARSVERAGLGSPRLVNPPVDRREE